MRRDDYNIDLLYELTLSHIVRNEQMMEELNVRVHELCMRALVGSDKPRRSVPMRAEQLLYFVLPKALRESLPGDLEEEFQTVIVPKFGVSYGRRWYWYRALEAIVRVTCHDLGKWVGFGAVADWVLRRLG